MIASVDGVIATVAVVLLIMSIWSWSLIFNKLLQVRRLRQKARSLTEAFWASGSFDHGVAALKTQDPSGPFLLLAASAMRVMKQPPSGLAAQASVEDQVTRSLRDSLALARTGLESGLTALASIGSTAPFIGLFGTVWSIFNALISLQGEGQVSIDQVSGPVGEALVMTAAGLFVAIPAVMAYNALVRGIRILLAELDGFAHDLKAFLLAQARPAQGLQAPVQPVALQP